MSTASKRNVLILFGPPGCGKGTHAPKIVDALKTPQLSTGDMLREAIAAGTEVGRQAEEVMKGGGLVSDEIVIGIIRDRVKKDDCASGFILDGFPRTDPQAKALDEMLSATGESVRTVIELNVPDDILEERICGRWVHKASGRSYHVKFNPPKSYDGKSEPSTSTMIDDATGDHLMQRPDDTKEALPKRLAAYHKDTAPILKHYGALESCSVHNINANQKMEAVWADTAKALGIAASKRNIMILFGPPGCGKGTHAPKIVDALKTPQLSTGDMLREAIAAGTEVGRQAEEVIKAGNLVRDEIVIGIIQARIKKDDCADGFILDGFPRTDPQAKALDAMLTATGESVRTVIELNVPDDILEERICGRWVHKASGRSYHVKFNPPKSYDGKSEPSTSNMLDDETRDPLMQRPDDTKEALPKRLAAYHKETAPILQHYGALDSCSVHNINANQTMEAVWADAAKALGLALEPVAKKPRTDA